MNRWAQQVDRGSTTVPGFGGHQVFVRWIAPRYPPRGGVLLSHGYSEHSGRYVHVMEDLARRGLVVMAQDHRGHGLTAGTPGFVEDRERVLADLGVVHRKLLGRTRGPIFGLAHSMGGLFFLRYLERYGDEFVGAILNAPALRIPSTVPRIVRLIGRGIASLVPTAPVQPFFNPERNTKDPDVHLDVMADPLIYSGWLRAGTGMELIRLMEETRADLGKVNTPLLVTHGTSDLLIPIEVSRDIIRSVSSDDVEFEFFEGYRHEIHNEPGQEAVLVRWGDWIEERIRANEAGAEHPLSVGLSVTRSRA